MGRNSQRKRLREIVSVLVKYGLRKPDSKSNNPVKVRQAMEELGPTFIKIGQLLSTRPDLIPDSYIKEFQKLQDDVRPVAYDEIQLIVEHELKSPIDDIFADFDRISMASASMAQVHAAVLKTGEKVAVKVQKPNVGETIRTDIAILRRLSRVIKFTTQGSILNIEEVVDEFSKATDLELDFHKEAANIKRFGECNGNIKYITCPEVYDQYTTSKILVMSYVDGIKVGNVDQLREEGYDLDDIGRKIASNYCKQVLEDGFFHADPHPGNIIISGLKIGYIDFGIMGTLSSATRDKFNKFLYGAVSRDVDSMVQSILRIGIKRGEVDTRLLHSDVEEMFNKYMETSLYDIDIAQVVNDTFKVCRRNCISMPRELTMLVRGMVAVEGLVEKLSPDVNMMEIAVPYVKAQLMEQRDYRKDLREQMESLYALSKSGAKIPVKFLELLNSTLSGKTRVQLEHTNLEKSVNQLNRMVNRLVTGIIAAALIIGSSLVVNSGMGPKIHGIPAIGFAGYIGAVIVGVALMISIFRSDRM